MKRRIPRAFVNRWRAYKLAILFWKAIMGATKVPECGGKSWLET